MKYAFIRDNAETWPVRLLARLLEVHPSGYYAWLQQPETISASEECSLHELVRQMWRDSRGEYGYRRTYEDLRDLGEVCSQGRVRKILKDVKIEAQSVINVPCPHVEKSATYCPPRLVGKFFHPPLPNLRWIVGASAIATNEGQINLAIIIDLFSGRIIRWVLHDVDARELQLRALQTLLLGKQAQQKILVHFDGAIRYTHREWRCALKLVDPERLIIRREPCQELHHIDNFFQWLLNERINEIAFSTKKEVQFLLFDLVSKFNEMKIKASSSNPLLVRMPDMPYGGYGFTL
ncbi:IS3 family transposase [Yersinia kristensenii]|uniref:IS3 family transposase n=1 Tax=Yersinia kristensenii TaxID=28152 RepID=UPI001561E032|nr:IS3 family transposase [Yersinia kristensenii]QKJ15432.1 IS3 family transposase [Yersinia kristensenii]